MELKIDKEIVKIIYRYRDSRKPKTIGLERICINKMRSMAENVIMRLSIKSMLRLKGEPQIRDIYNPKHKAYFQDGSWYQFYWWNGRPKRELAYFIRRKCERYFEDNSEKIIMYFLQDTYGTIEAAVLQTDNFLKLTEEFERWFGERRTRFMEQADTDIQKWEKACGASKPQSHGGVANLLKVLTKTMEKQGADITNIAKMQYAVCTQAGIYIPDEFVRDVAVTLDMKEIEQIECEGLS